MPFQYKKVKGINGKQRAALAFLNQHTKGTEQQIKAHLLRHKVIRSYESKTILITSEQLLNQTIENILFKLQRKSFIKWFFKENDPKKYWAITPIGRQQHQRFKIKEKNILNGYQPIANAPKNGVPVIVCTHLGERQVMTYENGKFKLNDLKGEIIEWHKIPPKAVKNV